MTPIYDDVQAVSRQRNNGIKRFSLEYAAANRLAAIEYFRRRDEEDAESEDVMLTILFTVNYGKNPRRFDCTCVNDSCICQNFGRHEDCFLLRY